MIIGFVLALELYLKCLLTIQGKEFRKVHKLSEFFAALEPISQVEIAAKLGISDLSLLSKKLSEHDSALVEWRYIYEYNNKSLDSEFIKSFYRATKAYIKENHAREINDA